METSEKTYRVIVAPTANDHMAEHMEFLSRVSENAANKLLDEILKDIRSLERLPERCPFYNRPYLQKGKYRYLLSCKRYRIIFQIDGEYVFVDDIHDCRQDENKNSSLS